MICPDCLGLTGKWLAEVDAPEWQRKMRESIQRHRLECLGIPRVSSEILGRERWWVVTTPGGGRVYTGSHKRALQAALKGETPYG